MVPPYPPGMAPIQQLPIELKDLICEFAGFEAHRTRDYHVSRPDETLSQDGAYTWTPHSLVPDKGLTNTQVYDDLRSLALVSRDFAAHAQRALFAIVALPKPVSYFRLLRTLLLNPERGRLIRCLILAPPRTFYNQLCREGFECHLWKEFIQMFTPTFCEEEMEMLDLPSTDLLPPNIARSRLVISWNPHPTALKRKTIQVSGSSSPTMTAGLDTEAHNHMKPRQFFPRLVVEALEAIIRLCPQLQAFHLLFSQAPSPTDAFLPVSSLASWPLSLPIGRTLFQSNPLLTTLTVDFRALAGDLNQYFAIPVPLSLQRCHLLPSSITHLTLIGNPWFELWHGVPMSLYALSTWLSENHGLKSLRVLNGLGNTNHSYRWRSCNWNTILLKYKSSLEELEFDGRGLLLGMPFMGNSLVGDVRKFGLLRFGEAEVLSCLGQMERLKVIKVPLHYLRRLRVEERQHPISLFTVPGVEIVEVFANVWGGNKEEEDGREVMDSVVRRDVKVDVEFPVAAKRIEVVVPGKIKTYTDPDRWVIMGTRTPNQVIMGVRTVVVRG